VLITSAGENTLNKVIELVLAFARILLGKMSMVCAIEEIKLCSLNALL
jgi:hypothetical protein